MDKKPNWWQRRRIGFLTGTITAKWENLGAVEHTVIRFKDYYLDVMELEDGGVRLGWADNPHMFPDVNINEFWTAVEPGGEA